jgi:hypothetical protein
MADNFTNVPVLCRYVKSLILSQFSKIKADPDKKTVRERPNNYRRKVGEKPREEILVRYRYLCILRGWSWPFLWHLRGSRRSPAEVDG